MSWWLGFIGYCIAGAAFSYLGVPWWQGLILLTLIQISIEVSTIKDLIAAEKLTPAPDNTDWFTARGRQ